MQITVRLFASVRETVGMPTLTLELPEGATLAQAIDHLVAHYPALESHRAAWHFAVNQVHAEADAPLRPGDTLAIFPYVAGG